MSTIGFIGLGHMGFPMAANLLKAGHRVMVFDLNTAAMDKFCALGGVSAKSPVEIAKHNELVFTMLQTGDQVKQVCLGEQGLYAQGKNLLHIDCSTIDVQSAEQLHQAALQQHHRMIDAPVSGGVNGAIAASLTLMVGGESEVLEQAMPYLLAIGKKIISTGAVGTGQAAKICNNMILGISMIAVSEAFVLASRLGLSAEKLFEVVNSSSGQCWAMSRYAPVPGLIPETPANHDYQPGFSSAMMLKDLMLSQQSASAVQLQTSLAQQATTMYQQFVATGAGGLDFSAIIKACSEDA